MPRITAAQAKELMAQRAVVVDVRDAQELRGKVAGALHISRGLLEFLADPESPAHNAALDKAKPVIVYCASGGRSATGRQDAQGHGLH